MGCNQTSTNEQRKEAPTTTNNADKNETNKKATPNTNTEKSVYDSLGGETAIGAVVDSFYTKVLASEIVKSYFENIDMVSQSAKLRNFVCFATGGPNRYEGRDMREAHAKMHLEEKHFDEIVNLLVATLKEFKVSEELIGKVAEKLLPLKDDILNR